MLWPWNLEDDDPGPARTVVMGHLPLRRPLDTGTVIALDTGCGKVSGGSLTAVILPDRRFISVGGE
jgi:serine/threonine protein phosphatase 1